MQKRWPRVTKPIMVGKTPCKLLCAFEVKVSNKLLARYKLLMQHAWKTFKIHACSYKHSYITNMISGMDITE